MARVEGDAAGPTGRVEGLEHRDGRLWLPAPGRDEPVPVTVRWLRPLTDRTAIVFLDGDGREVVTAAGVDAVDPALRPRVEEALAARYHMAVIARVERVDVRFGTRWWWVDTDRGPRCFALREPGKNVTWLDETRLVLRDTAGNRFEIRDLAALDRRSRRLARSAL